MVRARPPSLFATRPPPPPCVPCVGEPIAASALAARGASVRLLWCVHFAVAVGSRRARCALAAASPHYAVRCRPSRTLPLPP